MESTPTVPVPPAPATAAQPAAIPATPSGTVAAAADMRPEDVRTWAVAAHLSGFVAAYLALGFLGPLTVMLTAGRRSPYVRRHAVEALNFNLSALVWLAVSGVLVVVLIGLPMLVAVGVLYLVASVVGAVAAGRGEEYRYPLTLRFVR